MPMSVSCLLYTTQNILVLLHCIIYLLFSAQYFVLLFLFCFISEGVLQPSEVWFDQRRSAEDGGGRSEGCQPGQPADESEEGMRGG